MSDVDKNTKCINGRSHEYQTIYRQTFGGVNCSNFGTVHAKCVACGHESPLKLDKNYAWRKSNA